MYLYICVLMCMHTCVSVPSHVHRCGFCGFVNMCMKVTVCGYVLMGVGVWSCGLHLFMHVLCVCLLAVIIIIQAQCVGPDVSLLLRFLGMFKNLSQLLVLWKLPFRDKVRVDLASFFIKSSEILLVSLSSFGISS